MANYNFNYRNQDYELVATNQTIDWNADSQNYIRVIVRNANSGKIVQQINQDGINQFSVFYSSLNSAQFDINISPYGNGNLNEILVKSIGIGGDNDFVIYENNTDGNIYIKPNEIMNQYGLPEGNYKIQIDFLQQVKPTTNHYEFLIRQVSPSRREVRLKLIDRNITNDDSIISDLTDKLNGADGRYAFKHVLNTGAGNNLPITNFQFDVVTNGRDDQSIILRLYEPISVGVLNYVTIEKEVLITQTQDIYYFSDVQSDDSGGGLDADSQENWINPDGNNDYQNYNELTSSLTNYTIENIISQSNYNYPNLNIDYNEFSNHTFFGSAKTKVENFKTKIERIQNYYGEISTSLSTPNAVNSFNDSGSVVELRKTLFNKITDEIKSFTPYENFLYFDGQSKTTASAPGLGKNYADTIPVTLQTDKGEAKTLNGHDGFDVVYQYHDQRLDEELNADDEANRGIPSSHMDLFTGKYFVHEKPFFNYSGSIYLSFLMKSMHTAFNGDGILTNDNVNSLDGNGNIPIPSSTFNTTDLVKPTLTGSEYRRVVFRVSRSYWAPFTDEIDNDIHDINFNVSTDSQIMILSGSMKTASYGSIKDSTGLYPITALSSSNGEPLPAGFEFVGSCMPAGELFRLNISSGSGDVGSETGAAATGLIVSASFLTDVKVSFNDPTNVLPFDNIFHTSSADWTNWYNGTLDSASLFDSENIHSFESNLPLYIQESVDYADVKDFLSLQGEQYDVVKNHIDSLQNINKRGYDKTDSPAENILPVVLNNLGWEAINPFAENLSTLLENTLTGVTSVDDVKNQTWRKTLNNLIYIYKSKGTKNAVRALLNVYGYPPDVLAIQEFGGSTQNQISLGGSINDNPPTSTNIIDTDLLRATGSVSFNKKRQKLHRYIIGNKPERTIRTKWWMDDANPNTIEFVYKHFKTTNTQTILESSGSGAETLWDLRLVPSTDGISSSFEFRLNNSETGSLAIASNAVSMSTTFSTKNDGQLWNVMLQRMTSSISGSGTNEYRLHASLQDRHRIETYNYITMSVSGGSTVDSNYRANENWPHTGSFRGTDIITSSNLYIGETFSGSLAELKTWATPLSISRFRQHTLNKFSTVGNTINSHKEEMIYHFKLNENYNSSSISSSTQNMFLIDSSPTTTYKDYSFLISGSLVSGSLLYGFDYVNSIKFNLQDNTLNKSVTDKSIINPKRTIQGNLSPTKSAVKSLTLRDGNNKPSFVTSPKLELNRSPQDFVNDYILNNLDSRNFELFYGNPKSFHSSSYGDFDTFRREFFEAHPIQVDNNKFIRAMENMFNHSIIEGLKSVIPARSTLSDRNANMGVMIKPTILEKQKYEHRKYSIETNPGLTTGSIELAKNTNYKSGFTITGSLELPKSGSTSGNLITIETGSVLLPFSGSINVSDSGSLNSTLFFTSSLDLPLSSSINIVDSGSSNSVFFLSSSVSFPHSCSINLSLNSYNNTLGSFNSGISTTGSFVFLPKSGTIDYASRTNESFINIQNSYGTSSTDTHFINYSSKSADGDFNIGHIDTRNVFHMIGDVEIYSASKGTGSNDSSNFTDYSKFLSRQILDNEIHKDIIYESYISQSDGNRGPQKGRAMGKTRYFSTGSDGNIILPNNHVDRYPNPFKNQMYKGSLNSQPGFLQVQHEDYSTSSFYRVKVTGGETQIRVQSGKGIKDNDDRIIY